MWLVRVWEGINKDGDIVEGFYEENEVAFLISLQLISSTLSPFFLLFF